MIAATKNAIFVRAVVVFTLSLICSATELGQRGGKAEPKRIEFKPGADSATINGSVRDGEEAEYVFACRKGQRVSVRLSSTPVKSSVFQILGPDNDTLGLEFDANFQYSGVAPKTGDYFITVRRPTESKGTSSYKLTVVVKRR
ncbi:MAG TPA: hypothetical protein VIG25_03275 [Pyrinomonadaceae bacterium]